MTNTNDIKFRDSGAGYVFVSDAVGRNTSREIMEAIAFFARDMDEANALWAGDAIGVVANLSDIWEHATGNGRIDDETLIWSGKTLRQIVNDAS